MSGKTYAGSGVNYDLMDPFKKAAQQAGLATAATLERHGLKEVEWTRGESVHLMWDAKRDSYWGHVHEGLGTKNLVADAIGGALGDKAYYALAFDTLAMGLNDAATLGVRPTRTSMHLGIGSSDWLKNETRYQALLDGWRDACLQAGACFACGETPTLRDIILPDAAELSCAVEGLIDDPKNLIKGDIQDGDAILMLGSSGIGANGLTLARDIRTLLSQGYETPLSDGQTYGQALLTPTLLYGPFIEALQDAGISIHYGVNVTGHGWRKLMRLPIEAEYAISWVPDPHPVFKLIQQTGKVSPEEMYGNYNMGCGFVLYLAPEEAKQAAALAPQHGVKASIGGRIWLGKPKSVLLAPKGIRFEGKALDLR